MFCKKDEPIHVHDATKNAAVGVLHYLTWTKQRPTEAGYYWFRGEVIGIRDEWEKSEAEIVKVFVSDYFHGKGEGDLFFAGNNIMFDFSEIRNDEWYGPIEPPK